jgi:hypothetical protein
VAGTAAAIAAGGAALYLGYRFLATMAEAHIEVQAGTQRGREVLEEVRLGVLGEALDALGAQAKAPTGDRMGFGLSLTEHRRAESE